MTVLFGLVRRTWLVALVAVIACAVFAAHAVAALGEASYLAPVGHGDGPPRSVPTTARPPKPDGASFVARNMFCSTCAPVGPGPGSTDFVPAAVLIATSLGEDPRATIRVPGSEVQGSFGIGDAVPGVGTIATIGWVTVEIVDADGRHGVLSLVAAGAATPVATREAAENPWADRVHRIDDHTYEVDRSLVRELVSGAARPGGTRVLAVTGADGKLAGLRIAGAGTSSLAAALGLRNADVISEINGAHIESANTLLDLYAKLDQLNVVELDGTRAAKPLALTLHLR